MRQLLPRLRSSARSLLLAWRPLLRRLPLGPVLRRMRLRLALRPLLELRDLPHLRALPRLIRRRIRPARHQLLRSLQQLHLRLLLRLLRQDPASRPHHRRPVLACHCDPRQHRAARPREHARRQQRPALHGLLAHPQLCNVIRVPARLLQARGNRVQVRRKACARLVELRNNIVRAARRRVVLAERQGSVRVDRLRASRSAPEAVADRVVATIKDQWARSVPAREFPRRSQASRSMRASRRHAVGR